MNNNETHGLHNCDALEFMKKIPDNHFDCIFSDVPYLINGGKGLNGYGIDSKIFKHNEVTEKHYMEDLFRVLANKGHIYIMCNSLHLANIQKEMEKAGFKINNILVMVKNNSVRSCHYMKNCEFTIFARKGESKRLNDFSINSALHTISPIGKDRQHPTQKPISYVKTLIKNSTKKGDKVFDPFAGSGSTLVAARELGLDFCGCEIDEEYYNIASSKLKQTQPSLF